MNKKTIGLLRQAGQKQLQMRVSACALASGFVFSGVADFARPLRMAEPMTNVAELSVEQLDNNLLPLHYASEQKTLTGPLSYNHAQLNTVQSPGQNMTLLLDEFFTQFSETLTNLDLIEPSAAPQASSKSQESNTKINAENTTKETTTKKVATKKAETSTAAKTTAKTTVKTTTKAPSESLTNKVVESTALQESTSQAKTTVEKTTAVASFPPSVQTISRKTVPASLRFDANGVPLNYSRVITGKASAYYQGTRTSTGTRPMPGTVAVNPKQIPYGSKLWIVSTDGRYTYGYAVAEDTGGFIHWSNGPVVDLYMSTASQCYNFGVRNVKIYVLK